MGCNVNFPEAAKITPGKSYSKYISTGNLLESWTLFVTSSVLGPWSRNTDRRQQSGGRLKPWYWGPGLEPGTMLCNVKCPEGANITSRESYFKSIYTGNRLEHRTTVCNAISPRTLVSNRGPFSAVRRPSRTQVLEPWSRTLNHAL